jgi:arylsulfatase A-like enzyme
MKHNALKLITFLLSTVTWLGLLQAAERHPDRPNLIVFIADDIGWDDYGCYGNPAARTPNIDAIAQKGRRYTQAFLTASSCSPSRSSIITGRYPHNLGPAAELHLSVSPNIPWVSTVLRNQGYYTALIGKNHMSVDFASGTPPFPKRWDLVDQGRVPENSGLESKWCETLQHRPKDRPFFFWLAAADAHRGWDGDLQWNESLYGPKHRPEDVVVPPYLADDAPTRKDLASYYNEITRFDYFVGQMMSALKAENLLENTLVLILADNGRPFPRAKTRLHDSGMKTALVAHWPSRIKHAGAVCESLVSSIDIAPTLLEAAGTEILPTMQGVSLLPTMADATASVRKHAFSEHNWHDYEAHARCVRSDGFLYIRNHRVDQPWQGPADSVASPSHQSLLALRGIHQLTPAQADVFLTPRPAEELYHTESDPLQLNNLVSRTEHAEVRERLSKLLDAWMSETADGIPRDLTPDGYDRSTGKPLQKGPPPRGVWPGKPTNAHLENRPGPR